MSGVNITDIRKAKKRFYDLQSDLLTSKQYNFENNLKLFVQFCETDEIMKKVTEPLKNNRQANVKKWWEDLRKTGGSFVGSKRYVMPSDPEEAASLLYQFVLGIDKGDFDFYGFALDVYGFAEMDRDVHAFNDDISRKLLRALNEKLDELEKVTQTGQILTTVPIPSQDAVADKVSVFVVHGRNISIKDSTFQFLHSIGLKPIEWTQAVTATGKATPYIGEVLDAAFKMAQAIIVLMTPDDEGRLLEKFQSTDDPAFEKELTLQCRLNVIFEAGLAMGRNQNRTIFVEVGKLRPFSDIGGRYVIRMDGSPQKRHELAMRLQNAGCKIDLSSPDWINCGNFKIE